MTPRKLYFMGDPNVPSHNYSTVTSELSPWEPICNYIRQKIETDVGCNLNWYRDGNDYIAKHADKEAMGQYNMVACLSLGGTRRFYIYSKNNNKEIYKTEVHNGDLMIMSGNIQNKYLHTVPKQKGVDSRISLTYRYLANTKTSD